MNCSQPDSRMDQKVIKNLSKLRTHYSLKTLLVQLGLYTFDQITFLLFSKIIGDELAKKKFSYSLFYKNVDFTKQHNLEALILCINAQLHTSFYIFENSFLGRIKCHQIPGDILNTTHMA